MNDKTHKTMRYFKVFFLLCSFKKVLQKGLKEVLVTSAMLRSQILLLDFICMVPTFCIWCRSKFWISYFYWSVCIFVFNLLSSRLYHPILNWFETVLSSYLSFPLIQLNLGQRQFHSNINLWIFFSLSPIFFSFEGRNYICVLMYVGFFALESSFPSLVVWGFFGLILGWGFFCWFFVIFNICCSEWVAGLGCGFFFLDFCWNTLTIQYRKIFS